MSMVKDWSETYIQNGGIRVKVGMVDVESRRKGKVITFGPQVPVGMDVTAVCREKIEAPG